MLQSSDAAPTINSAVANNQGILRVLVSTPDTQITIGNTVMTSGDLERTYFTPSLQAGRYSYTITANWMQNGQAMTDSRTVIVAPQSVSVVDFTRPAPAASAK